MFFVVCYLLGLNYFFDIDEKGWYEMFKFRLINDNVLLIYK